jgi:ATP-binding cassette subfamily B protein
MSAPLLSATWPLVRVGEAVEALGRAANLDPTTRALEISAPPEGLDDVSLSRWIENTARWLDLEAEAVLAPYAEVHDFVRAAAPALVRIGTGESASFVALLGAGRRSVTLLDSTRARRTFPLESLAQAIRTPLLEGVQGELDSILERISPRRRDRARAALMRDRLGARSSPGLWILRSTPGAKLGRLATRAHLPRLVALVVAAQVLDYGLVLASWWAAAMGALQGRFDSGWLIAWALLLVTLVPLRWLSAWCASRFSISAGTILKTRLLVGALRLDPNAIRHQGAGQLLGRVLESSAVETLGLTGGLVSVVALVESVLGSVVLAGGAGGALHVAAFLATLGLTAAAGWRYYQHQREWTRVRLTMTHDLVERMVGHRTRIAQESRARWHDGEDQALEQYLVSSRELDRRQAVLALAPRAWLLLGMGVLAPQLLTGSPDPLALALALGGILLGQSAITSLTNAVTLASGAAIGWTEARSLVRAATTGPATAASAATLQSGASTPRGAVLLRAEELEFRYRERGEPVLHGCSLEVRAGDRLLLEGPSGGGKSTLGSLITGLRHPDSGLLLLGGLDRHTLGADTWHRRVVAAPQFHENHVFSNTFAFNLLLGRAWPPSAADLEEAERICRELDLGALLDRMPAGLQQMVGETGWQLSHGEKSRLYIARALLQDAEMVVLDESFAALDPRTLRKALECVLERARTLLVIAHP